MDATDDRHLQPLVAAELSALADALQGVPEDRWDTPSLCEGWRVREVVAHMTMAARYSPEQFAEELRASRFDFGDLSNRVAARDAALPVAELLANLRSATLQHWAPPGGGFTGALNHAVIHALDVTVPLGLGRLSPNPTIRTVLDGLTIGGIAHSFGRHVDGVQLRATDLDWTYGSAREVAAPAASLVLALAGRRVQDVALP